jgi:hypothetical protein
MAARPRHAASGFAFRGFFGFTFAAALAIGLVVPLRAAEPDATGPVDVEEAKVKQSGRLNSNTMLYSGPGSNFYPTMKLEKGAMVTVAGLKNNQWLKIVPPEGSYSYVPKAFVHVYGDGKQGKVNTQLIVKAGSTLQPQVKWAVQTKLEPQDTVQIIEAEDEYYKIKPPTGAFLFISNDAVDPLGPVQDAPIAGAGKGQSGTAPGGTAVPAGAPKPEPGKVPMPLPPTGDPAETALGPTTQPGGARGGIDTTAGVPVPPPGDTGTTAPPTTKPAALSAIEKLQKLEAEFSEASKKPLQDQPVAELLAGYQELAATPGVADSTRKIADVRAATLKIRQEMHEQYLAVQEQREKLRDQQVARDAERQELEQRLKETEVQIFTAVGTLRPSSLQVSRTQLYRLTDPANGRTVCYVWASDPKLALGEKIGSFLGVKGKLQTDPRLNLKVINPTAAEAVEPAKVNTTIAAEIVPPSLMPKATSPAPTPAARTASTTEQPQP